MTTIDRMAAYAILGSLLFSISVMAATALPEGRHFDEPTAWVDLSPGDPGLNSAIPGKSGMKIEGVIITPGPGDVLFPSVVTDFKVIISNSYPVLVDIYLDDTKIDSYMRYENGQFRLSPSLEGLVHLLNTSSIHYNQTIMRWEIDFQFYLDWEYPLLQYSPMFTILAEDKDGNDVSVDGHNYRIVRDLILDGEGDIKTTDPSAMSSDGRYIRGGSYMVIMGMNLHFYGHPTISPDPEGIVLSISDDKGTQWNYRKNRPEDLNWISLSFQIPYSDGETEFRFFVSSVPEGARISGEYTFEYEIDSTDPKIGDFRFDKGTMTFLSWSYSEIGSGMDQDSLLMRWERTNPREVKDWFEPENVYWSNDRFVIEMDLVPGDYFVQVGIDDNVDNGNTESNRYYFSTRVKPIHDLSVENGPDYEPDILIAQYLTTVKYQISNKGTYDEYDVEVSFYVEGVLIQSISLELLPAGSTREVRFEWVPYLGAEGLRLVLDENENLLDEDRSNNELITHVKVRYRDISLDTSSMTSSDPDPIDMEKVILKFRVDNFGDLESPHVMVRFLQDGNLYGEYHIDALQAGTWDFLTIDWKASYEARALTIIIDPYNEIPESREHNRYNIDNPFYHEPEIVTPPPNDEEGQKAIDQKDSYPDTVEEGEGWIIIIGPEDGEMEPPMTVPVYVPDEKRDSDKISIPLFTIPFIGFTITSSMAAGILIALRNEAFRYKFLMIALPLYSKLKKDNIEQGTRYEILGYLKARPGANYSELKDILDLNDGSLMHHLRILEREEKIYSKKVGKYKLFYVTSYKRQPSMGDYVSPFQRRILEIIYANPGILPKTLSSILNKSQTDISYHLSELARNGFLEKKKAGRNIHYYIKDEYLDIMMA